jgi:ribosomal-protein-alanine N-acetyltransferase
LNLEIKVISHNDANIVSRLVEIENKAFGPNGLSQWEIVPFIRHGLVVALLLEGKVIGGAQFLRDWKNPDHVYLFGIAVDSDYRGKGFGTRFLSDCCLKLKEQGFSSVELTVDAANVAAVKVYKDKLGFETVETRIAEYGKGEDRLVMIKTL